MKGKKWIVGSGTHGFWIGSYEYEKQSSFAKEIKERSVVYDIGAHAGFYTILSSELVGEKGKVIAFEPSPENIRYLKEHVKLNKCNNVKVVEAAVAERSGKSFFKESTNSYSGNLSSKGVLAVQVVSLDDFILKEDVPAPDFLKIDVEGAEMLVLSGAKQILADNNPTIFLATHGADVHKQCCAFLRSAGYDLQSINNKNLDQTDEILAFKSNK